MATKTNLLLVIAFLFSIDLYAQTYNKQNTYVDALALKRIFDQNRVGINLDNSDVYYAYYEILKQYGIDRTNIDSNIFLKEYKLERNEMVSANDGSLKMKFLTFNEPDVKPHSASPMDWQASAINGLANFMAGRFKQEVLQVAIDQIFKQITSKDDAELVKSVFPRTFKQIENLYSSGGSSYYTADLIILRETAQIDIEQLPENIIKNSATIFPKLKDKPEITDMLLLGNYIVKYSKEGQSLDQMLSILANESYSKGSSISKILNVSDLISQALLNEKGSKDIWVNPINLLPVTTTSLNNIEIRLFYGLLYQQLVDIPEFKPYLVGSADTTIHDLASKMEKLLKFVNSLNNTYKYIEAKKFTFNSHEEIVLYINEVNQSLSSFMNTVKTFPELNDQYKLADSIINTSKKYIAIASALIQEDYQKAVPLLLIEFGEYMQNAGVSSRSIVFISQLATIETAEDMEALLKAYALPIGSSSIKRHSSFNLSVNGYVGLTGGRETAYGSQSSQTKWNVGISAPIGIASTFSNGYLTLFVSFLDLGTIVNQRFDNDTTSYPNLRLEHFFAPGLGLFFNLPNLPISAGVHFNYIPNLRTIKYDNGSATVTETERSVTRINASILVDIPFFTLYNKEKPHKKK